MAAGSVCAMACGFEDPNSVTSRRGILNFVYPKSLYVTSAVWQAQLDGVLPRTETAVENKSFVAGRTKYDSAVAALGGLRDRLTAASDGQPIAAFSVVLLGPVLWTRFVPEGSVITMTPHASGPASGDIVIVTDEPVMRALLDEQLTPSAARELGLIRFYGEPERVQNMITRFDQFSAADRNLPLETVHHTSN